MHHKKRIVFIATLATTLSFVVFVVLVLFMKQPDPSKPVAVVNGVEVTLKEWQRELKKVRDRYAMQNVFPEAAKRKQLEEDVLERIIERELLWQDAVQQGMVVSDKAVLAELETMKKQYGNETILNNMLKNWKMSRQEYLELIKKDLTINALIKQNIGAAITISDAACKNYYQNNLEKFKVQEQIRVSHICIFTYEDDPEDKLKKAHATIRSLQKRLKEGESFEDLAREASECASSERGGDLGFIERGAMDPQFDKTAFALKLNKVSPIVRSSLGYHIIKVTDRKPARLLAFDEVKTQLERQLKERIIDNRLKDNFSRLQKQADVKRL